jgi:arabinofuranosyltransferase
LPIREAAAYTAAMPDESVSRGAAGALARRLGSAAARVPEQARARAWRLATVAAVLALLGWVVARAWVSDDAAITARSVDNLLRGYGWRWNVDERVQSFTHPSWALLLIAAMATGASWHLALLGLGLGTSAAFLLALTRRARSPLAALCGLVALAGSRSFADYATSGLENPLANLLLGALVVLSPLGGASTRDLRRLSLGVALLALTRQDLALLGVPILLDACLRASRAGLPLRRIALACALGQLPLVAWEAFSIVYFGFPFPNTAYAKLDTGIDALTYAGLGLRYYRDVLARDPWTLLALPALAGHAVRYRASSLPVAFALGLLAYLAYIVAIGGDFMSGRFFVAPLACAVVVAVSPHTRVVAASDWRLLAGTLAAASVGLLRPLAPLLGEHVAGVVDERSRNKSTSLVTLLRRGSTAPDNRWLRLGAEWRRGAAAAGSRGGRPVVMHAHAVGMLGLAAGPDVHVIDHLALTDPFLARLPAAHDPWIQVGHFERMGQWSARLPVTEDCHLAHEVCRFWRDYAQTIETGRCTLADADACRYWEALQTVTRGELFSAERWRNIWRFNTGELDGWIDRARFRDAVRSYPASTGR